MNKQFRKMIKEINDGKNLEVILPQYSNAMAGVLNDYSSLQLALEYYGLKEYIEDEISENKDTYEEAKEVICELNELVKTVAVERLSVEDRETSIKKLDAIRNTIMQKMDVLTMYTDTLRIYEYVLNRFELDFSASYEEIDEALFIEKLNYYLFASKDNVVINSRIQEMVGQLPVRMLKSKFFDYVKASLDRYKDSDAASLETFEYMLRTNAMLYRPEKEADQFLNLKSVKDELESADYGNLDKETYRKLCSLLIDSSVYINQVSDIYLFAQKVINNLYIYVLTMPYTINNDETLSENCRTIVTLLNENFDAKLTEEVNDQLMSLLDGIVGKQEVYYERYIALEGSLTDVKQNYMDVVEAIQLKPAFESFFLCEKLTSNSVFIDIHKQEEVSLLTEERVSKAAEAVINEMTESFKAYPQCINRAIMANVLSTMPVFFQNTNEVMDYARASLEQCKNIREKTVAMRLLLNEMVE
ncbi:MAG: hypothetical protein Q4F05_10585 [bacterium]|nr:hypothetical protein [bacterium]